MSTTLRTLTESDIQPGRMSIQSKDHPEWGTFGISEKYGDGMWNTRGARGGFVLMRGELHFWNLVTPAPSATEPS